MNNRKQKKKRYRMAKQADKNRYIMELETIKIKQDLYLELKKSLKRKNVST